MVLAFCVDSFGVGVECRRDLGRLSEWQGKNLNKLGLMLTKKRDLERKISGIH